MPYSQIRLSRDQLIEQSREITGISHIDDVSIREPLDQLLNALNTEAQLNEEGADRAGKRILGVLCTRLRMLRDFDAHPEIEDQEIVGPLFITGLPRSGTTKLHKMLAASGDFYYNKLWQVYSLSLHTGDRNEDPSARIEEADDFAQWFETNAPLAKYTHHYQTHEPEEEHFVFEHCRFSALMLAYYEVPSFLQWLATQDPVEEYRFLKKALKYMQWQRQDNEKKLWLLKYPFYLGTEFLLREVFPDAKFVVPHRNPLKVVASSASLLRAYRQAFSDTDYSHMLGPMILGSLSQGTERIIEERRMRPDMPLIDISYTSLVKDAESTIEKIYALIGKPISDQARQAMKQWEDDNQQHKQGAHSYTLGEFGVTEEMVSGACANYLDSFGDYLQ